MNSTTRHVVFTVVALVVAAAAAFALFVISGAYNFAADEPHTSIVSSVLETMRERSIESRASGVTVPDLADDARIARGAGNYEAMCSGCHLAPGVVESELSKGLYPAPPNLSKETVEAGSAFWVVKHGIKASGMPAWGKSMGDDDVWDLVAFLRRLPALDQAGYAALVDRSGGHHHDHPAGHDEVDDHAAHDAQAEGGHIHAAAVPGHADVEAASSAPMAASGTGAAQGRMHVHADGTRHQHVNTGVEP